MSIQCVDRALTILELLHFSQRGLGVSQIAQDLGLHVSTTHHLLQTLQQRGYIRQHPETRRYSLAHKIMRLASRFPDELSVISIAFPHLRRLCATTGESVRLAKLGPADVIVLVGLDTSQASPPTQWPDRGLPAHCTALGKVLLAALTPDELRVFVQRAGLRSYTQRTITSVEALEQELERVRAQGFGLDCQEYQDRSVCVGAGITDAPGRVKAAVSIACPIYRHTDEKLRWLTEQVVATAHRLSAELGTMSPPLGDDGWE
jgi:DNA-binding IclR family transcriptional regulator